MLRTNFKKFTAMFIFSFALFALGNIAHTPKASALGCYPNGNAAYFNAQVMVQVQNPDGSFRKWSDDFSFRVTAADPKPFGNKWFVPTNGINFPGRPGFPTDTAIFNARAGDGITESCPTLSGTNGTSMVFGDSTDGKPFLACNWGTWGGGPGNHHGLAFYFNPVSINDPGGSGYWDPANSGYVEPGGLRDANNQQALIIFVYRLTTISNPPEGWLERADCNLIEGWARDLDAPGGVTNVHLYFDDPSNPGLGIDLERLGKTRVFRGDPGLGGDYGFRIDASDPAIPVDLYTGTHTVYAYGIDAGGSNNRQLSGSPKTIGPCPVRASTTNGTASTIVDNVENPGQIDFGADINQSNPAYDVTITRRFYMIRADGTLVDNILPRRTYSHNGSGSRSFENVQILNPQGGPLNLRVGDQICTSVIVDSPEVTIGFRGSIISRQPAREFTASCRRFVNLPYMSFQGGDVSAGGDFTGGVCSTPAGINTNVNAAGLGAGVEFAALAIGNISGFASARGHGSANSLMFSNTTAPPGQFGGSHCIKDYYSSAPAAVTPGSSISVSGLTTGNVTYNGTFTLNGGTLGNDVTTGQGVRTGLYINGDLIIAGNIDYASASWPSLDDIPSLHIYVKGNIYIQENVTSINAMLVAQPSATPNSGKIVTCASGTSPVPVAQLFARCGGASGTRLTVRGALIANKVEFLRTSDSLRNASGDGGANAAELVDLSPEFLLVAPISNSNVVPKDYQYFTTLPPVL